MKTILSIDRGEIDGFCVMRGTEVLYLGNDSEQIRNYDIDIVIVNEPFTVEDLKKMLGAE